MIQDVGVGAAGVFKSIGKDRQAVEAAVLVDSFGEPFDGIGEPRGAVRAGRMGRQPRHARGSRSPPCCPDRRPRYLARRSNLSARPPLGLSARRVLRGSRMRPAAVRKGQSGPGNRNKPSELRWQLHQSPRVGARTRRCGLAWSVIPASMVQRIRGFGQVLKLLCGSCFIGSLFRKSQGLEAAVGFGNEKPSALESALTPHPVVDKPPTVGFVVQIGKLPATGDGKQPCLPISHLFGGVCCDWDAPSKHLPLLDDSGPWRCSSIGLGSTHSFHSASVIAITSTASLPKWQSKKHRRLPTSSRGSSLTPSLDGPLRLSQVYG